MSREDEVRFCPMCGREQPSRTFVHAGNDWVCAECAEELAENKRRLRSGAACSSGHSISIPPRYIDDEGDNDSCVAGKAGRGNMPQVQGMRQPTPAHLRRNKENY